MPLSGEAIRTMNYVDDISVTLRRILTVLPPRPHPIVLLVTDGEEAGLLGASLFTREHRLAGLAFVMKL